MNDAGQSLSAGHVGRPHGLDGSFYVTIPRPRLLTLGAMVTVGGLTAPIVRRAGTDARPIVRLEGVDDRLSAEALRGSTMTVAQAAVPELADGEWWAHELEGCAVVDGEVRVGVVSRLLELPSCEALEVIPEPGARALLIPMVKDAVRSVDTGAGRIEVNLDFLNLAEQATPKARAAGDLPAAQAGGST